MDMLLILVSRVFAGCCKFSRRLECTCHVSAALYISAAFKNAVHEAFLMPLS